MKFKELKEIIERYASYKSDRNDDDEVVIALKPPYTTVGGSPYIEVKSMQFGFDWDNGRFFIYPISPLWHIDNEQYNIVKESQNRLSKMYEDVHTRNRSLEQTNKRLRKELKDAIAKNLPTQD